MKRLMVSTIVGLSVVILQGVSYAVDHYIRSDATGSGSGSDWANAWSQMPASYVRGDKYFVADGDYDGFRIDTAVDGTKTISIVKATAAQHGTDVGWSSSMGDGQASFAYKAFNTSIGAAVLINTSYVVFDGITGEGSNVGSYGFRLKFPADCWGDNPAVYMQPFSPTTGSRTGTITSITRYTSGANYYSIIADSSQSWTANNLKNKFIRVTNGVQTKFYKVDGALGNSATSLYSTCKHDATEDGFNAGDAYALYSGVNSGEMPLMWLGSSLTSQHFYGLEVAHTAFPGSVCGYGFRSVSPIGLKATTVSYMYKQYGTKIHHNYFDDTATNIVSAHGEGTEIYNNYFGSNYSGCGYETHGQQISNMGSNQKIYNNVFRNSTIAPIIAHNDFGTDFVYIPNENMQVFNNVFVQDSGYFGNPDLFGVVADAHGGANNAVKNWQVHHNTVIGYPQMGWGFLCVGKITSSDFKSVARNNLFVNCANPNFDNCTYPSENVDHSYSAHFNSSGTYDQSENGTAQVSTDSILVNPANGDYGIVRHTLPGIDLGAPFDKDFKDVVRNADGMIDRGAFEFAKFQNFDFNLRVIVPTE